MNQDRIARIRACLETTFNPDELEIIDDSHLHAGHEGAKEGKGHFRVTIVSDRFAGTQPIERHRMVYDALRAMMDTDIHALSISATPPVPSHSE